MPFLFITEVRTSLVYATLLGQALSVDRAWEHLCLKVLLVIHSRRVVGFCGDFFFIFGELVCIMHFFLFLLLCSILDKPVIL